MFVVEAFGDMAGILAQMDLEKVVAMRAPQDLGERVQVLTEKRKQGSLSEAGWWRR